MAIALFDDQNRRDLYPLTLTRPVSNLRVGILTIAEKWGKTFQSDFSYFTEDYLSHKYPLSLSSDNFLINGALCPDKELTEAVKALKLNEALIAGEDLLAVRLGEAEVERFSPQFTEEYSKVNFAGPYQLIRFPEDIFKLTGEEIKKDFRMLTEGRLSMPLSSTNTVIGDQIFLEEGATAECSTFNCKDGPIYLAKNSQVWEGCHIRGPFGLGEGSIVKMGAKIYSMTSIGPHCKVAGEINNSVIWGNSSKGHEGYLGNSVVGEWCNFGADSNNSNMKNNYAEVKLWDYTRRNFRNTGLQFCGMIMGDHSKCAINTMFNTGTVVGVSANIFGSGFPRQFIADFSWGGSQGFEVYSLKKMFETACRVYQRKGETLSDVDRSILEKVFEITANYRNF